ncbi:serine protease [Merismopedia glauca]|uniref:Uncharacterized protein n=1 Tax=Merismopedia glauca CCAP 1448/3 TaxID=1296344 RepID=A0A2T1BZF3_9CYAN|nr:serine protease [Merismopedia glauca]PSB01406.1 hypothetical protein C7B64_18430 [Merismopedia glauca CCAP 1448/3]
MHLKHGLSAALIGTSIALVQSYSQTAHALTAPEVSKIAKQITVRIEYQAGGRKKQGSGFIIKKSDNKYYVVTAYHVVADEAKYSLIAPDGERYTLDKQKINHKEGTDLAVVEFTSSKTYQLAKTGNSDDAPEGTTVYVAGFPAATSTVTSSELYRFLKGEVSANASQPLAEGYSLVYTNPTLGGMSGGPVLNDQGEVIAIHGKAETQAQTSGDSIKIASTGNNLGISVNTFLRLALLDTGVKAPPVQVATAPKADDLYLKGTDLSEKKDYRGAIEAYSKALEINPKYAKAYFDRGNARYYLKEYAQAIADYTQAIALDPKYAFAYYNRGNVRYELKQYDQAIADYTQAIALDPKYAFAYNNRGNVRYELKQYDQAIADYTQAIALDPKYAQAYYNRGNVRKELKQYDQAIADYTQAIALDPKYAFAYNNRGVVRKELKQYDQAIADYTQAIALDPKYAFAYNNRGIVRYELKQYDQAIADYTQAIALDPKLAQAYNNRGFVYYDQKKVDAGISDWRKALSIDSQISDAKLALGVALYNQGQRDEGLRLWREGVKLLGKTPTLQFLKENNAWSNIILKDAAKLLKDPRL